MLQTLRPDWPELPDWPDWQAEAAGCALAYRSLALTLAQDGLALTEISHALEVSPRLLLYWVHQTGLPEPPRLPSSLCIEMLAMDQLAAGTPIGAVARALEVSVATLRVWARAEGLEIDMDMDMTGEPLLPRPFVFVRDAALAMLRLGLAVADVARTLSLDNATVRDWARRSRVKPDRHAERSAAERAVPLLRRRHRVTRR